MPSNKTVAAGIVALTAFGALAAPAHAKWRFHPERCPALIDRPAAVGPERRGAPVAVCPTVAWAWHGEPHLRPPAPAPVAVHYHHGEGYYYRLGPDGEPIRIFLP